MFYEPASGSWIRTQDNETKKTGLKKNFFNFSDKTEKMDDLQEFECSTHLITFSTETKICRACQHVYICGNNGQGKSLITFIWSWQFKSQINTNSTQWRTEYSTQNKWADLPWRGGANTIQVKMRISNCFRWTEKIGRKNKMNKEKESGISKHDKIIQYFPHICYNK
jgi:hypothetical protein